MRRLQPTACHFHVDEAKVCGNYQHEQGTDKFYVIKKISQPVQPRPGY